MKFTCPALLLCVIASPSIAEIASYPGVSVSYYAESTTFQSESGATVQVDEFDELFDHDVELFDLNAGGHHLLTSGELLASGDSQGFSILGSATTSSYRNSTLPDELTWGQGRIEAVVHMDFQLLEHTDVVVNASTVVDGNGTASFRLLSDAMPNNILSDDGNSAHENIELSLAPGLYSVAIFFDTFSTNLDPAPDDMPDFASVSFDMSVVPAPGAGMLLPIALSIGARRRR